MTIRNLAGSLFMACRETATVAHVAHLSTRSYAEHMALGEFYTEIVDLADEFVESYQGRYGLIRDFSDDETMEEIENGDNVAPIYRLRDWIDANRAGISDASEIQNLIDEIVSRCNRTLYKLENLL